MLPTPIQRAPKRSFRQTLDVNREIEEAAQNCANAKLAYNNYHTKISSVYAKFSQGKALLIDIHGQVYPQRISHSLIIRSIQRYIPTL